MNNINDDHEMAGLREHREAVARLQPHCSTTMLGYETHCWGCGNSVSGSARVTILSDLVYAQIECKGCGKTLTDSYEYAGQEREKRK